MPPVLRETFYNEVLELLDFLGIDFENFTIEMFLERIHAKTRYVLELVYFPHFPELIHAVFVKKRKLDHYKILVNQYSPKHKQEHAIIHDFGHLLLGHDTIYEDELLDYTNPSLAKRDVLEQVTPIKADIEELEAEMFANIVRSLIKYTTPSILTSRHNVTKMLR